MIKGIEELRQKRLKWIEANRENNFEEGIKRLLTDLYPDNAHFIYELLQNAEDPRASIVRFTLTGDAVEFEHDGERLFDLRDVESITSIGASTKRDDPTSIGKFGVGFKAVFAYTHTPEIHSGEFHFRIRDLVLPETNRVNKPNMRDRETRFTFPFDHPTKRPAQATAEVERALRALGDNTLLFLTHIRTIEYLLPDGSLGSLERVDHEGGRIEIRARHPGGKDTVSHWLRFQKDVEVIDEDGKTKTCRIAIAYSLVEEEDSRKRHPGWKIVPLDHGQVSIYFPAEKETSNLRFHIHAPFASTVARDSVRDCEANRQLRDRIAELVVESLADIRDRGMLTMSFLAVLPNQMDNLPSFYEPVREAIVRAFNDEALTPTRSGTHAPATGLYRGTARIAEVLSDDDLSLLTNYEAPLWAANPPQQNQREDRFLDSLEIDRFGWAELIEILSMPHAFAWADEQKAENREHKQRIESWIEGKEDAWVMRFYALLGEACDTHDECMDAKEFRIVRVEVGQGHEHVLPQNAFFPPEQEATPPRDIRIVKPAVYSAGRSEAQKKSATSFLEHIGVRPFDAKAAIELRLNHYYKPPQKVDSGYYRDLKQFIAYWKRNPTEASLFRRHDFLLGTSEDDSLCWCKASELCLDAPYLDTGLAALTRIHKKHVLWAAYKDELSESQLRDFVGFLQAIGVLYGLRVTRVGIHSNPNHQKLWHGLGGTRETGSAIREDYSIDALEQYLGMKSIPASRLVWQALIRAEPSTAKARYRPNQQYQTREVDSQIVYHLRSSAWIPDKSGLFRSPRDMTREDLRTEFPYDDRNGLLTAIGFGEHAKKRSEEYRARNEAAKKMGFGSAEEAEELAKLVSETGVTPGELRSLVSQRQRASQPEESVPNPERRRKGVLERRDNAPTKESVIRERTIQPAARPETLEAKAYLRAKYRNPEGQLVCQCCHAEMPFKVRDDHYFEAVQCVRGLDHHYFENRLALCPTCAAMYQHARETDDAEIRRSIIEHDASDTASSAEITIRLAGRQFQLRFVGTHWFDLKTVLNG
ncbi:sacsin N-terminal ATP-binding-like domain-containing protein [Pseudomonas aeruginosa]|uniref:sacsin N-terminal ATP-binding-like domain-containing protein n=1 Tax=Pseudomonas aeruginosa TaxID=287 RepID=UPI001F4A18CE|nr:hypothetical protein [Pseudomonas aeruginosa]